MSEPTLAEKSAHTAEKIGQMLSADEVNLCSAALALGASLLTVLDRIGDSCSEEEYEVVLKLIKLQLLDKLVE